MAKENEGKGEGGNEIDRALAFLSVIFGAGARVTGQPITLIIERARATDEVCLVDNTCKECDGCCKPLPKK